VEYEPGPPDPFEDLKEQIAKSPRADEEAELMTLWITGDVVAYQRDYDRVRAALSLVRETHGDSVPYLDSVQFVYRYQEGVIGLALSETAVEQLRAGTYVDWDSLNALFRVAEIDTTRLATSGQVDLTFEGRLNPDLLVSYYARLDSVETYLYVRTGDYPNIYPWKSGYDHTFLLRQAWGDCMRYCDGNLFWYFKVVEGEPLYLGEYNPEASVIPPAWWGEASASFCKYIKHPLCPLD
jgi:hypothetical protein